KTFAVSPHAEIGVYDGRARRFSIKEGKLTDVAAGALVTLTLSLDQKQVEGLIAEGPSFVGLAKSVDTGKNMITLTIPQRGNEAEEKTVAVAPNAVLLLDDGKGRRFSLKEGK